MNGFWRWKQRETVGNYDEEWVDGYIDLEGDMREDDDDMIEDFDEMDEIFDDEGDEEE
jgi:hypothetical protein